MSQGKVTVGLDIGTTSVKGVVAAADGEVLARVRVPHPVHAPAPQRFEHDVATAWQDGPREALRQLDADGAAAIAVAAMVPSLAALDAQGQPLTRGLLYGDERGVVDLELPGGLSGEAVGFLRALAEEAPDAASYQPAQAVANATLAGVAALDSATAASCYPLHEGAGWNPDHLGDVRADQLPEVVPLGQAAGEVDGVVLASGLVDALGEQIVAGAEDEGDVLVMMGTTLLTWAVVPEYVQVEGLWTIPHTVPDRFLLGGPSNAGGLFLDQVRRWIAVDERAGVERLDQADEPDRVPVWLPYVRGERTPLHRRDLRAALHDADLTHRPVDLLRAGYEASAFVVRHHLDLAGVRPRRLVATGGGTRSAAWLQALADAVQVPVDVVAVHEGGALGAAFVARMAAGLERELSDAHRWARRSHRVEPDPAWADAVAARYGRFRSLVAAAVG